MSLRYMADGDYSLVRYDTEGDRHSTCEVFGHGGGWKPMEQTRSVFRGDYEPISPENAAVLERKLRGRITDLKLVQRVAGGEMSVPEVLEHLARTERPTLSRPTVRTFEAIESEPDRLPLSDAVSALYGARYAGTITEDEFWAVYKAMWPDVGATS